MPGGGTLSEMSFLGPALKEREGGLEKARPDKKTQVRGFKSKRKEKEIIQKHKKEAEERDCRVTFNSSQRLFEGE